MIKYLLIASILSACTIEPDPYESNGRTTFLDGDECDSTEVNNETENR
jgi:hypothetical protein